MNNPKYLSLYRFDGCPWCERVRIAIADLNLEIEERDIRTHLDYERELQDAMGSGMVPVLRIDSKQNTEWIGESSEIVRHLYANYGGGRSPTFFASQLPQRIGMGAAVAIFVCALFLPNGARPVMIAVALCLWLLANRAPFLWRWLHRR